MLTLTLMLTINNMGKAKHGVYLKQNPVKLLESFTIKSNEINKLLLKMQQFSEINVDDYEHLKLNKVLILTAIPFI